MKDLSGNILKTDKQGNNLHQAPHIGNVTRTVKYQHSNISLLLVCHFKSARTLISTSVADTSSYTLLLMRKAFKQTTTSLQAHKMIQMVQIIK